VLAILDIDGTLVDTNYHHAIAWYRAFRQHGLVLPIWRIHRHIGMGGDQLVRSLTSQDTEDRDGDSIRTAEGILYAELINEVQTMRGARELIAELKRRGHQIVFASSAKAAEVDHYLKLLDGRELADGWTTAADVEATKPRPDLVQAALQRVDASPKDAVLIGDTPWDAEAARRARVPMVAVLTGGFSEAELRDAKVEAVYESVADLRDHLDETPFAG
jgi:HAD superfamily hydrolase (TIGR01509 family)